MKLIGKGIYKVGKEIHFDIPEILKAFGYEDTPKNRDICTELAGKAAKQVFPNVPQSVVKEEGQ
ncbi:MAG: hypothetical protein FVQ81_17775 [Candidatus Glassbacteria bacterium]|nr:hypothetical protein [Candidatus Glassbacteria bacterium]